MYSLLTRAIRYILIKLAFHYDCIVLNDIDRLPTFISKKNYGRNINRTLLEIFSVKIDEHEFHSRNLQRTFDNDWRFVFRNRKLSSR